MDRISCLQKPIQTSILICMRDSPMRNAISNYIHASLCYGNRMSLLSSFWFESWSRISLEVLWPPHMLMSAAYFAAYLVFPQKFQEDPSFNDIWKGTWLRPADFQLFRHFSSAKIPPLDIKATEIFSFSKLKIFFAIDTDRHRPGLASRGSLIANGGIQDDLYLYYWLTKSIKGKVQ